VKGLPEPRAVIFDWDDTLVDTWEAVRHAVNATLVAMDHPPWSEEEALQRIGPPSRILFTQLFGEDRWHEADRIFLESYLNGVGHVRAYAQAEEILGNLFEKNVYLAVVSAKRGALLRKEAAYLKLDAYFKRLVGAGDAVKDKPDAEAVYLALKGSGIEPGPHVWFIGDSYTDMTCAANAGCTAVLLETKIPSDTLLAKAPPAVRFKTHQALLEFFAV
jgi:phosphoglycolate phosphatase